MKILPALLALWVATILPVWPVQADEADPPAPREKLLFDSNWKFHLGDEWPDLLRLDKAGQNSGPAAISFDDFYWRTVNLPHDWAVELPFDKSADGSHGFKPVGPGFESNSIAWYRRTFDLPATDAGKRIWLDFDGVYRDATVFVNGWYVKHNESGYYPFRCDITDLVNVGGKNVVAVKVDATKFEGWFYEGAGIYRHVWLEKTSPVAIVPDGVFVHTDFPGSTNGPEGMAQVKIEVHLANALHQAADVTVQSQVFAPDGQLLDKTTRARQIPPSADQVFNSVLYLLPNLGNPPDFPHGDGVAYHTPALWSPEDPKLYKLVTTVSVAGAVVDEKETEFGIRTVAFDKDKRFLLNGQPYELKGTCNHQDMAGVGAALPDALQYFRIKKLKEFGDNAYRTSHNPPTPELLEACDRLGMIVMDENRVLGSDPENLARLETFIKRDRNHPAVCIWNIANEESAEQTPQAGNIARTMQNLVKSLDPTRPVTYASPRGLDFDGINAVIEVRGWNYHAGPDKDRYHAEHPEQPNVGTEQGSTVSTRGIYTNDTVRGYVSAYDVNAPPWAQTAEAWWSYFAVRPWLSGGFVWTGFDYRGEPTPYSWPCINSHFGILDTCGFPKDNFYYYQSWWTTNTVLHLLPHWNWPGMEGKTIRVDALSNCQAVELFLNGKSLGKQTMQPDSKLTWQVVYEPGTLSAKGYDANGNVIAEAKEETTGAAVAIKLTPDRTMINADGEDVSVFRVSALDAEGREVPVAQNLIRFDLSGAGRILGVGNGDPSSHEPDTFMPQQEVHTAKANSWRYEMVTYSSKQLASGKLPEYAPDFDDSTWSKAWSPAEANQLTEHQSAIFRQHFTEKYFDRETPLGLTNIDTLLHFGRINDIGWIYVNGHFVGESRDWRDSPGFSIKKYVKQGDNLITVGVKNVDESGGIGRGVSLQFINQSPAATWSRSLFNGLAEVIVQSTKDAGEIKLTASADGLQPITATVKTQAVTPRPYVP